MGLFDCDCACAQAPDYSGMASATEEASKYAYKAAADDLAFRKEVYNESKSDQNKLRDMAYAVAAQQKGIAAANEERAASQWQHYENTFKPQETLMSADALGMNYLTGADRVRLLEIMNNPRYSDETKAKAMSMYGVRGEQAMINKINTDAGKLRDDHLRRADQVYALEKARAEQDFRRAQVTNEAAINSSYGMQGRELSRRGFNPARIASAAANLANQQALARVHGNNQMHGLNAQRMREADDRANAIRWNAQDQWRATTSGAKEQAGNKYASLRAGAAAFGRNMPNTAGQAYGLATGAGSAAVGSQGTGFQSGLPYANFVSQGTGNQLAAAGLQQQGALGMGGLYSRDYATAQGAYNNMESGGGLGGILGSVAGAATTHFLS